MRRVSPLGARELAALVVLAVLALPAGAQAARVKAQADECAAGAPSCVADLSIEAESEEERNDLPIRPGGAGIVVTDTGNGDRAGAVVVSR